MALSNIAFIPYDSKGKDEYGEDNYNNELVEFLDNARLLHKPEKFPMEGVRGIK